METGSIPAAEKLRAKFPAGLLAITRLPGLGPKRARLLYDELGIDSLEALRARGGGRAAARSQGLRAEGGGRTSSRAWPPWRRATGPRSGPCSHAALAVAEPLLAALRDHPAADRVELAGSARRWTDSVKDLDLIATAHDPEALANAAAALPDGRCRLRRGPGRRAPDHLHRDEGRPAYRRARAVRQPAPALHRLQAAQRGAATRRRSARTARVGVRGARRRRRRDAARAPARRRSTSCSASPTSSPSCARTAASWRPRPNGELPDARRAEGRQRASCTPTPSPPTARTRTRRWRAAARERGLKYLAITDHSA